MEEEVKKSSGMAGPTLIQSSIIVTTQLLNLVAHPRSRSHQPHALVSGLSRLEKCLKIWSVPKTTLQSTVWGNGGNSVLLSDLQFVGTEKAANQRLGRLKRL
jgi:hypothetical protein